ncbi:MAG: PadR family transcriptional regulator [Candidatus Odinarchaeota archaeon]
MQPREELPKWEKEFKKGFSKPFVLFMLAKEPHYPYQIIKTITKRTQGKFIIAGANIYPLLRDLKDEGLISYHEDKESQTKFYSLTEEGYEFLDLLKESLSEFIDVVKDMMDT